MRFLQRQNEHVPHTSGPGDAAGSNLDNLRAEGNRLLAASDEAIQRALAGSNSESFLEGVRQAGGQ